jgi:TonB family protein
MNHEHNPPRPQSRFITMRLLVALLLGVPTLATAQIRIRPMGEFRAASKGVRVVATFEARSTGELVLDANERIDQPTFNSSAHCVVPGDAVARWADSTTTLVNQQLSRPQAPEKIEYEGPELPSDECVIRVDRTIYASGSMYSLVVASRAFILSSSVVASVTQAQALGFIGKLRGTATVTVAMSPRHIAPGEPTNPAIIADTSATLTSSDQPYFEFQVEKQVAAMPGNPAPRYPDVLRSASVEGEVLAQFVVDTNGRAVMNTFKVLKSSHDLFTTSVKDLLVTMRFYPAEVAGRKVRQLVQMPFVFSLNKEHGDNSLAKADAGTVSTGGVDFPYPGYLENVLRQIALRFSPTSEVRCGQRCSSSLSAMAPYLRPASDW